MGIFVCFCFNFLNRSLSIFQKQNSNIFRFSQYPLYYFYSTMQKNYVTAVSWASLSWKTLQRKAFSKCKFLFFQAIIFSFFRNTDGNRRWSSIFMAEVVPPICTTLKHSMIDFLQHIFSKHIANEEENCGWVVKSASTKLNFSHLKIPPIATYDSQPVCSIYWCQKWSRKKIIPSSFRIMRRFSMPLRTVQFYFAPFLN